MEYRDEKRRLFRKMVEKGARKSEFRRVANDEGVSAPDEMLDKWEGRFFQKPIDGFPSEPRLVNRFCVGADPEFIFESDRVDELGRKAAGKYMYAENYGMNTMDAFGCDMSGRQAELRAYPSRFVIEVCASIADTLRWMGQAYKLDNVSWIAPARYGADGCGGHIHIGRKRPDSERCITSLDAITNLLLQAGVLDQKGQEARRERTIYGRPSDWRPQTHGYEYRTMPTWLPSPWSAYFTLVVSKLAVMEDVRDFLHNDRPQETLINLLRAYKGRDDDARIALLALDKIGFPRYMPDDFKKRWGVAPHTGSIRLDNTFFPPIIEGSKETCKELFNHLVKGTPMPLRIPLPNWLPFHLPKDLSRPAVPRHIYGIPDVAQGLLARNAEVTFGRADRGTMTIFTRDELDFASLTKIAKDLKLPWNFRCSVDKEMSPSQIGIYIPTDIADAHTHSVDKEARHGVRTLLTESGHLPLLKYEDWDKPPRVPGDDKKKIPAPEGRIITDIRGSFHMKHEGVVPEGPVRTDNFSTYAMRR